MATVETGRYKRVFEDERKVFHLLVHVVAERMFKDPLDPVVRVAYQSATDRNEPFDWWVESVEIPDKRPLEEMASTLVGTSADEAPLRERFSTSVALFLQGK